jgi:hypothetical protein
MPEMRFTTETMYGVSRTIVQKPAGSTSPSATDAFSLHVACAAFPSSAFWRRWETLSGTADPTPAAISKLHNARGHSNRKQPSVVPIANAEESVVVGNDGSCAKTKAD